ncbi:MAG: hypothetical protein HQL26_08780 [Candidatus Omnitrophica bacterium]|nr:hypothetical protein [Candidatus Omnitrophota bacterium]
MARNFDEKQLLQLPAVIEEIKRHLWLESEKKGYDIGFEKAKQDWLDNYADGWIAYFKPDLKKNGKPAECCAKPASTESCVKPINTEAIVKPANNGSCEKSGCCGTSIPKDEKIVVKKRSAKSYM